MLKFKTYLIMNEKVTYDIIIDDENKLASLQAELSQINKKNDPKEYNDLKKQIEDMKLDIKKATKEYTLELSGPQGSSIDPITGEYLTAKVLHPSFSLPAGYTCPYATECRSRTTASGVKYKGNDVGVVVDGPLCKFRCFAASNEAIYADARAMRNRNMEKLTGIHPDKDIGDIRKKNPLNINVVSDDELDKELRGDESKFGDIINAASHTFHDEKHIEDLLVKTIASNEQYITSIGKKVHKKSLTTGGKVHSARAIIRVHVSGDFYSQEYFNAWMKAAAYFPDITFYAYTKSIPYWVKAEAAGIIPPNFKLNASYGGSKDDLIKEHEFTFARVCFSREEADNYPYTSADHSTLMEDKNGKPVQQYWKDSEGIRHKIDGLPICEEDDSPAYDQDGPFALLLHGVQPKGSEAAEAISDIDSEIAAETLAKQMIHIKQQYSNLNLSDVDARIATMIFLVTYKNVESKADESKAHARIKKVKNAIGKLLDKNDLVSHENPLNSDKEPTRKMLDALIFKAGSDKFDTLYKKLDVKTWVENHPLLKTNIKETK
jgi:hypothetical protein